MVPTMTNAPAVSESRPFPAPEARDQVKPKLSLSSDFVKAPNLIVSPSQQAKKVCIDDQLLCSSMTRKRRRTIKFNKIVHNRRIPHLNDFSQRQIEATWIQPQDYLDIRASCVETVKKMMRESLTKEDIDSEEHCPRGLEGKTKAGSTMRRGHKLDSISAVLEEQALQWNEDVEDEEAITEVYSMFTSPCTQSAHQVALQDAKDADRYCHEESSGVVSRLTSQCIPSSPVTTASTGVVERLREMLFLRSSKAAILQDIQSHFFDEVAMERRRTVYEKHSGSASADQLRNHFSSQKSTNMKGDEQDIPSLASTQCSSSAGEDDSVSNSNEDDCASSEHFTTQLQNHFHSRKRRQALLDSIENGHLHEKEAAIVTISAGALSSVSAMSNSLGSRLQEILGIRKKRNAVVDELRASSHLRQ